MPVIHPGSLCLLSEIKFVGKAMCDPFYFTLGPVSARLAVSDGDARRFLPSARGVSLDLIKPTGTETSPPPLLHTTTLPFSLSYSHRRRLTFNHILKVVYNPGDSYDECMHARQISYTKPPFVSR